MGHPLPPCQQADRASRGRFGLLLQAEHGSVCALRYLHSNQRSLSRSFAQRTAAESGRGAFTRRPAWVMFSESFLKAEKDVGAE